MPSPYLTKKVEQYNGLRAEIVGHQTRAASEDRDLTDEELRSIRDASAKADPLYKEIVELQEEQTRSDAVAQTAARIDAGRDEFDGPADRIPQLMPSAAQIAHMRRSVSENVPLRFTTTDQEPTQTRAVVTMAGDAGTPTGGMSARALPEPTRIATAAGLAVEPVAGASSMTFPVFGAGTAGVAAENAAKTEYSAIDPGTATPQVINAFTDYTRQLAMSHGGFENRLRAKLAALVAAREDVLLQAKVMATVGIQTQAFVAGSQANQVLVGAAKVQAAVSQFPDLALVNPADVGLLFGAGLANTPPDQLAQLDLRLFGMKVYPTNAQTAGFVLIGAWRACSRLVVGMNPTYFVDPYSGLKNNRITTLLEEAVDLAVEEPAGFISVDIIV